MVTKIRCVHCETQKSEWCDENCHLAWMVDTVDPEPEPQEKPERIGRLPSGKARKIECIDTGEVFESAYILAGMLGVSESSVVKCCNGKLQTLRNNQYRFLGDTTRQLIDIEYIKETKKRRTKPTQTRPATPIYDRMLRKKFDSTKSAHERLKIGLGTIYRHLLLPDDNPMKRFEYIRG